MAWSEEQRNRLALEKQLLEINMPGFYFYEPTGNTYVFGEFPTNCGNKYGVRVEIPLGFPDQCPKVYITTPNPLWGYGNRKKIADYGIDHLMHTLSPHANGWIQVCHFKAERWTATCTLYKILIKVRLWLEAYEGHRNTGKFIDDFLGTME
jgi:ubiquitin-protein ligase